VGTTFYGREHGPVSEHTIRIQDGRLTFVYDDALVDLVEGGQAVQA
jgi:hypothetical protein